MLALYEKFFLIFVFSDVDLPAISGISNQGEEISKLLTQLLTLSISVNKLPK